MNDKSDYLTNSLNIQVGTVKNWSKLDEYECCI